MKKLFTLFMATVVAMSMMALPQVKLAGKKAAPASHEQFEAKTPAQAKVMEMHKAEMVKRSFERPASVAKVAPAVAAPKKVAKAEGEVVKLHFDGFSVAPEYYEETGDWYMACANDEYIVKFDIVTNGASYLGHWTTEDFDLDYAYMYTPDYVDYLSIDCTISEEKKGQYLTQINLAATIEGSDGITYEVTCEHLILVPASTEEHLITDATLEFDGEKFTLAGTNDTIDVNLAVYASWPAGRFTKGEFDLEETSVKLNGVEQVLLNPEVVMDVAAVESVPSYVGELQFFNQDTVLHKVSMVAPLPEPTDTVEITLHNLNVDDSWAPFFGWVYLTGVDAKWDVYAGVAALQAEAGTWEGADVMLNITDQETFEEPEAVYAKITVTEGEDGWVVYAEGQCDDGKYYVVNMDFVIPEPTEFKTVTFETSASAAYYPDLGHDLMLQNSNDDFTVAVDVYGVPMGGTFSLAEGTVDANYSAIIDGEETVQIASLEGKVYQEGDTTRIDAVAIGFNAVQYTIELWYAVPTPTETKEIVIENADFVNYIADQGLYQLYGYAENGIDFVSLAIISDQVEGTYVNDGVFSRFGAEGGRYDLYTNYNYVIKVIDPETEDYEQYMVEKGEVVVTVDENNIITAKADVICSNAVHYLLTVKSEYNQHLLYDAEEPVEKTYTAEDVVTLEYDADYGFVYFDVIAADMSDMVAMYFFVEEADADITIPAGTYTIDDTEDYNTVLASTGVDDSGSVYPSFYAQLTEDGNLIAPLWFMVAGTVEVSKTESGALYMEINALNSYDQPIHIVYDGAGSGLENINVEAQGMRKQIVDGQLVIIRDGKAYNAMGAQVK